ncbi:MAG: TIM-barrel domain-containing protein [Bacteroidota bacterium]
MIQKQWYAIISFLCFASGVLYSQTFKKQPDGIVVELTKQKETDPQWMKIQFCTEDIVHVLASPTKSFSNRPSLMVDKANWKPVPFSIKEKSETIDISTSKIIVTVLLKTGAVAFRNANGQTLLQEKSGGGKIITPTTVMGEQTFHVQQLFNSQDDEAFYGLGGHQNSIMNYKGHDVDLWQHNMVVSIPFLVSSKNYGILWDNTSHSKFGDIREYQSLSTLKLFSKDSVEGTLTAEYFKDAKFNSLFTFRNESRIEHEFIDVNDAFPPGFENNVAAVRWSGEIESQVTGVHKFKLYSSGYVKLWLDGKLVIDSWRQNWNPWNNFPQLEMQAGKRYQMKLEWIHTGGYIGLKCLTPESEETKNKLSMYSEVADQIDYYFVHGDNLDQVISGYRTITGKAPMMPKWAMGFWQSREHYNSQDDILSTVQEFRKRHIPLDNIVQDWFYWKEDQWGSHEFDPARYPDPRAMIQELHQNFHTQLMISVWPKFYVGIKNYDLFNEKGWLYKRNVEKAQKDWVGPGYVSTFYDSYNADAQKLFWKLMNEKLFNLSMDAWWLDCSEPDICSDLSRTETILRQHPTALGSAYRYLNAYSLMNAKAVYEGQRSINNNQRVYILTRSAFAGQQRYAATTWSGDIASRWYDLKAQISSGVNFSLTGIPYWSMDIGGFAVESRYEHPTKADLDEWRELNTRWYQFGSFCPIFRVHGQFPLREIYNMAPEDHPAYQSMLAYNKLRYRLMPYIYSLTGMVTQRDYTIMRGLVMDFGSDKNVLTINDQFMFGPALLVNPVSEYKSRSRAVYLPSGSDWYEYKTGKSLAGGQTIQADAPYSEIPLYIKAGSIIPCGPEIQYTTEKPADPIRVFVYTGSNGSFTLYEDENTNYNYEKEKFASIPLTYNENRKELVIGKRQGSFTGMLKNRSFEIIFISKEKQSGMNFDSNPDAVVVYDGSQKTIKMK